MFNSQSDVALRLRSLQSCGHLAYLSLASRLPELPRHPSLAQRPVSRRRLLCIGIVLCMVMVPLATNRVWAAPVAGPKILLYLAMPTLKNACRSELGLMDCANLTVRGDIFPNKYYAYVLVKPGAEGEGVTGAQFGISYDNPAPQQGVDLFEWHMCADLEYRWPTWPSVGSGNMVTWDAARACATAADSDTSLEGMSIAGYFYLAAYSADALAISDYPEGGQSSIMSCGLSEDGESREIIPVEASGRGIVRFSSGGNMDGYNPCSPGILLGQSSKRSLIQPLALSISVEPAVSGVGVIALVSLPSDGNVRLSLFDISGRLVRNLATGWFTQGVHNFSWNYDSEAGNRVSDGVYFYKLVTPNGNRFGKLLVRR